MMNKIIISAILMINIVTVFAGKYEAAWDSLRDKRDVPEWLQDAKFGIWFCWGPASYYYEGVPLRVGNPLVGLYKDKDTALNKYFAERFGEDPQKLGWHGVIQKWQPKNFDPKIWVDLFIEAGAKYGSIMADHEDGFVLWDSEVNPWNPVNYGPKVDIVGELAKEYRRRGMKVFIYANGGRVWKYAPNAHNCKEADYVAQYPKLYLENHVPDAPPSQSFSQYYFDQMAELIDKYQPDALWFDVFFKVILPDADRRRIIAHYYNMLDENNKLDEGVFFHKHGYDLIPTGANGHERGVPGAMQDHFFGTGNSLGVSTWYPRLVDLEGKGYQDETVIIPMLVDIVCKNGFLNLATIPDADGNIPDVQVKILKAIGVWLKQNGKAIYETRPWIVCGEGPFLRKNGAKKIDPRSKDLNYTSEEFRFTRSKDGKTLYVITMAWPEREFTIKSIGCEGDGTVSLLGYGKVAYQLNDLGQVTITMPKNLDPKKFRRDLPIAFKLAGFQTNHLAGVEGSTPVQVPQGSPLQSILWRVVTDAAATGIPEGKEYLSPRAKKTLAPVYNAWMSVNAPAITQSKPWVVFGEGPNLDNKGRGYYTGKDFRFSRSKDGRTYYAIAMAKPKTSFIISSMWCEAVAENPSVSLLGHGPVTFQLNDKMQLEITFPDAFDEMKIRPDLPMVFEIRGFKVHKH